MHICMKLSGPIDGAAGCQAQVQHESPNKRIDDANPMQLSAGGGGRGCLWKKSGLEVCSLGAKGFFRVSGVGESDSRWFFFNVKIGLLFYL